MDIALPPTATPTPSSGTTPHPAAVDAEAGDSSVDGASSTQAFGAQFTKHLNDNATDAGSKPDRVAGRKGDAADPLAAATAANAANAVNALKGDGKGSTPSATDALHGDKDDDKDDDKTDDSAAQLAVISQWAQVAKPAPVTDAQAGSVLASSAGTARPGLDARGAIGTTRSRTDDKASITAVAADGIATPRSTASTTGDALAKTEKDAALAALGSTAAVDAGPSSSSTTNATIAIGDLFATRMATTTLAAATAAPPTPTALHETVGTSAWSQEVGQVALRMTTNDVQSASLRLNPEHLGPLDVQVRVDNGVTHLAFNAAHADTRQALEASRPTLDQMFTSQGIKMGEVSVGQGSVDARGQQTNSAQADTARRDSGQRWNGSAATTGDDTNGGTTITARITGTVGLVDTFA